MSKTVLITGAGSGFGELATVALDARGHHVIATTETDAQASSLREKYPTLQVEKLDITTGDVALVSNWTFDVLINNAGAGQTGPLADVPIDRVRRLFDVNVFGTLAITQEALKQMVPRGSGRIIIVSSIAGVISAPTFGPYSMTKHALEAFGKALRGEVAGMGVDVTLLNPGPYNTGFNDRMAQSMWEWFGEGSLTQSGAEVFKMIGDFVTTDQMDPNEVATRMVELVEADATTENNFVPANLIELVPKLS
jgi:short-subunit dehydrogenase